jgi:hypothetical protein
MTIPGRLFACLLLIASAIAQTAQQMPAVEAASLNGDKVVLPEAAKGKVAILIFGFTKASKTATSAWADKIFSDFAAQSGFVLYQLPVLESVPGFIRGMVISSMKKGVRENMRDHFVPILHGEAEPKKLVSYKEPDDAYLVMLDPTGQIIEQKHGPFSDAAYAQLRADIQSQLSRHK